MRVFLYSSRPRPLETPCWAHFASQISLLKPFRDLVPMSPKPAGSSLITSHSCLYSFPFHVRLIPPLTVRVVFLLISVISPCIQVDVIIVFGFFSSMLRNIWRCAEWATMRWENVGSLSLWGWLNMREWLNACERFNKCCFRLKKKKILRAYVRV